MWPAGAYEQERDLGYGPGDVCSITALSHTVSRTHTHVRGPCPFITGRTSVFNGRRGVVRRKKGKVRRR